MGRVKVLVVVVRPGSPVVVPVDATVLEFGMLPMGVREEFSKTPFTM